MGRAGERVSRTVRFWCHVVKVYGGYKLCQARAKLVPPGRDQRALWARHHAWAGDCMLSMCLGLKGFYIKSGQFIGARGDFVPAEICERLAVLHDAVPPMGEAECRRLLAAELGCPPEEMFAEFDYAAPLGSASVAQVHRARLAKGRGGATVAVKLQNASQLDKMDLDLKNIAAAAAFLERTELKFDLSTAVEELAKQVRLEFDFQREAETMRRIRRDLRSLPRVKIPKCIAATPKVIVMEFLDGLPLKELLLRADRIPKRRQRRFKQFLLRTIADCYGHQILGSGLFQADAHPGNLLLLRGGRFSGLKLGLLDFGQAKLLSRESQRRFSRMVAVLADPTASDRAVAETLEGLGVDVQNKHDHLRNAQIARDMFSTEGDINPFSPDSPIKGNAVKTFPRDLFFVLRVVQLLRGLKAAMGDDVRDFSSARRWRHLARRKA